MVKKNKLPFTYSRSTIYTRFLTVYVLHTRTRDRLIAPLTQRLTVEQAGEDWEGLVGEEYEDGETMEDILRRVEYWDAEVPRYPPVPGYDDPYVPDVQE